MPFIDFIEQRLKSDPGARKILAMEESRRLARNYPVVKRVREREPPDCVHHHRL